MGWYPAPETDDEREARLAPDHASPLSHQRPQGIKTMTITVAPTYTTTDGKPFTTRKEAEAHQKFITRKAAIEKALTSNGFNLADGAGTIGDAATFVAAHGDAFAAALTIPSNRGPKPKTAATAA